MIGGNRLELFRYGENWGFHACEATFSYILPPPNIFLTRLLSKLRLKRKDFQEILRLPWAQEVPSSNLGAPTNYSFIFGELFVSRINLLARMTSSARSPSWPLGLAVSAVAQTPDICGDRGQLIGRKLRSAHRRHWAAILFWLRHTFGYRFRDSGIATVAP